MKEGVIVIRINNNRNRLCHLLFTIDYLLLIEDCRVAEFMLSEVECARNDKTQYDPLGAKNRS